MDIVLLSRIQFGLAAGFHFIFPPLTLGLTLIIFILESAYLSKGEVVFKQISSFFIKILGLIFVIGTATGIVLEFSFGTNWAEYSRVVGDVFGAPLAAEGILAFFLESVFIGVLLFGRNRVSKKAYWLSAFLVFFASHMSGLWILIANSWMQTPAGYVIEGGRAVLTDFFAAVFNPSSMIRFIHVVIASWITGSVFVIGIGAWYIIKGKQTDIAQRIVRIALPVFMLSSALQFAAGHSHSVQVTVTQPVKMAAYEALWDTTEGAPLSVFGLPDVKKQKTYLELAIPKFLSFLVFGDFNAKVLGINEFPKEKQPPILIPFYSYHIMILLGTFFLSLSIIGLYLLYKKRLFTTRWYLKALVIAIPLPHIANESGWLAAEVGRQPWIVYGVLKTADAVSKVVPALHVLFSIIMFIAIYALLFIIFLLILTRLIKKGPDETLL